MLQADLAFCLEMQLLSSIKYQNYLAFISAQSDIIPSARKSDAFNQLFSSIASIKAIPKKIINTVRFMNSNFIV